MKMLQLGLAYAVGDVVLKGVSFVLAFLYARYLTPSEFGILAIATAVSTVVSISLTFGTKAAAFHFHFAIQDAEEERRFYGSIWIFSIVIPGIFLLLLDLLLRQTTVNLLRAVPYQPFVSLALWGSYLNNNFRLVLLEVFRAKERPLSYAAISLGNSLTLLLFIILFVAVGSSGVTGVLVAMLLSGLVWAPVYSLGMARHMQVSLDIGMLRRALEYSLPMLPHFIAHWVLELSDRLILDRFVSAGQVGIYSLGYKVGNAYQIAVTSGNNSIMPRFAEAYEGNRTRAELSEIYTKYIYIMGLLALVAGLLADEVITIFTPPSYHGASAIARLIVVGFFVLALYYGPMNSISLSAGRTQRIARYTILAGLVNIGSNLLLVPRLGILAAAINTVISYTVLVALIHRHSQRVFPLPYQYGKLGAISMFLAIGMMIDARFQLNIEVLAFLLDVALVGGFLALGRIAHIWDYQDLLGIWDIVRSPFSLFHAD